MVTNNKFNNNNNNNNNDNNSSIKKISPIHYPLGSKNDYPCFF